MIDAPKPRQSPLVKLAMDLGPLVLFFAAFKFADIFVATGVFMAASIASLGIGYAMTRISVGATAVVIALAPGVLRNLFLGDSSGTSDTVPPPAPPPAKMPPDTR